MKKSNLLYLVILLFIILTAGCSTDDVLTNIDVNNTAQVVQTASEGNWRITYFKDSGKDETAYFTGYQFSFNSDGSLLATNNKKTLYGRWSISDDDSKDDNSKDIDFNISFKSPPNFEELSDDWDIIFVSDTKISLKDGGDDEELDLLIFEKL